MEQRSSKEEPKKKAENPQTFVCWLVYNVIYSSCLLDPSRSRHESCDGNPVKVEQLGTQITKHFKCSSKRIVRVFCQNQNAQMKTVCSIADYAELSFHNYVFQQDIISVFYRLPVSTECEAPTSIMTKETTAP